jgi:hypothetical protein
MKKFDFTEITNEVFCSTKIAELEGLSERVRETVKIISMLDDGSLMDQLTNAHEVVKNLDWTVRRLQEVHGDFHLKTQSQRLKVITKIAKG